MYPFIYWAQIYETADDEVRKVSGCTFADNFSEAMANIEVYYGDELVSIHIESLEAGNVIEFSNAKEGKAIVKSL